MRAYDGELDPIHQAGPPPEPGEATWSALLRRIDEQTQTIKAGKRQNALLQAQRRAWWRRRLIDLGIAAAMLVGVLVLHRRTPPEVPPLESHRVEPSGSLPVTADEDVEIISMDAADMRLLVVGRPPLHGAIVLAEPGEVVLESVAQDTDGMLPKLPKNLKMPQPWDPMIVAPLKDSQAANGPRDR